MTVPPRPTCLCVPVALQRYVSPPPVAQRQLALAMMIAKAEGARVRVVSVEAKLPLVPQAEGLREKLQDFVRPLFDAKIDVDFDILTGRPGDVVPQYFVNKGCDLLVLGSHSKRGVLEAGLGNVATSLSKDVTAPIVLVRPSLAEIEATKALMIPEMPWMLPYF